FELNSYSSPAQIAANKKDSALSDIVRGMLPVRPAYADDGNVHQDDAGIKRNGLAIVDSEVYAQTIDIAYRAGAELVDAVKQAARLIIEFTSIGDIIIIAKAVVAMATGNW